jgi:hypothetical protein
VDSNCPFSTEFFYKSLIQPKLAHPGAPNQNDLVVMPSIRPKCHPGSICVDQTYLESGAANHATYQIFIDINIKMHLDKLF